MIIKKEDGFLTMDSLRFKAEGVDYLITGTHIIDNVCTVDLKNLSTGKRSSHEHQKLCKMIQARQDKAEVKQKKTTTTHLQTGLNL